VPDKDERSEKIQQQMDRLASLREDLERLKQKKTQLTTKLETYKQQRTELAKKCKSKFKIGVDDLPDEINKLLASATSKLDDVEKALKTHEEGEK